MNKNNKVPISILMPTLLMLMSQAWGSENKLWVLEDDAQINEAISAAAQAMKSDLPKQMDPMTTWIGADNSGRRSLLYTYQLNFTANDLGGSWSAVARGVEKNNQAGYCTNPGIFWYRDNDVAMEWRYLDKNREFAFQVKASLSDCDALESF